MKYCPECGKTLPLLNPKHCPECGAGLQAGSKASSKPALPKESLLIRILLPAILLILFVVLGIFYPVAQWERSEPIQSQYYQSLTAFSKDALDLSFLYRQYEYSVLSNASVEVRAKAASNYLLKSRQALASWEYFSSFLDKNAGVLQSWDSDVSSTKESLSKEQGILRKNSDLLSTIAVIN